MYKVEMGKESGKPQGIGYRTELDLVAPSYCRCTTVSDDLTMTHVAAVSALKVVAGAVPLEAALVSWGRVLSKDAVSFCSINPRREWTETQTVEAEL